MEPVGAGVRDDELEARPRARGQFRSRDAGDAVGVVANREAVPVHAGGFAEVVRDLGTEHVARGDPDLGTGQLAAVRECRDDAPAQVDLGPLGTQADVPHASAATPGGLDPGDQPGVHGTAGVRAQPGPRGGADQGDAGARGGHARQDGAPAELPARGRTRLPGGGIGPGHLVDQLHAGILTSLPPRGTRENDEASLKIPGSGVGVGSGSGSGIGTVPVGTL